MDVKTESVGWTLEDGAIEILGDPPRHGIAIVERHLAFEQSGRASHEGPQDPSKENTDPEGQEKIIAEALR